MITLQYTHYVPERLLFLWKIVFCRIGWHAWDETWSSGDDGLEHYLSCDACDRLLDLPVSESKKDNEDWNEQ